MKKLSYILVLLLLFATPEAGAQMTRGQLLRKYYQITQLHNSGKDAEAIAICEEITAMYPKLPDTYLRMAQIYDDGGEKEMALVMYRTYASLEMNDKKLSEISPRMKELEEKLGAKSFEEQEQENFDKLMAETAAPAITSSATSLFDLSALVASANTAEPEPEPEEVQVNEAAPEPQGGQEVSLFDIVSADFTSCLYWSLTKSLMNWGSSVMPNTMQKSFPNVPSHPRVTSPANGHHRTLAQRPAVSSSYWRLTSWATLLQHS